MRNGVLTREGHTVRSLNRDGNRGGRSEETGLSLLLPVVQRAYTVRWPSRHTPPPSALPSSSLHLPSHPSPLPLV